jgi:hypothetical protein
MKSGLTAKVPTARCSFRTRLIKVEIFHSFCKVETTMGKRKKMDKKTVLSHRTWASCYLCFQMIEIEIMALTFQGLRRTSWSGGLRDIGCDGFVIDDSSVWGVLVTWSFGMGVPTTVTAVRPRRIASASIRPPFLADHWGFRIARKSIAQLQLRLEHLHRGW